ncbi:hypothetical protein EAI_08892, partial [Harpegnathos saltator]
SPQQSDPRGEIVFEWGAALDLHLMNRGDTSTCVRLRGESVINLTWASLGAARLLNSWVVETEMETLSDHNYVVWSLRLPAPSR